MEYMFLPLKRYAQFSGRSRRMEYWMFWLFQMLVYAAIMILMSIFGGAAALSGDPEAMFAAGAGTAAFGLVYFLFALAMIIPNLAVTVRRLHDTGRTGWWVLAPVLPWILMVVAGGLAVGSPDGPVAGGVLGLIALLALFALSLLLLVFMLLPGTTGPNSYGPDPKGADHGEVFA